MELTVKIHSEDGSYWAEVPDLPGCFASGHTLDELMEALSESVALYLHDEPTEPTVRIDEMRVAVPA